MSLKITNLRLQPYLPGVNELTQLSNILAQILYHETMTHNHDEALHEIKSRFI